MTKVVGRVTEQIISNSVGVPISASQKVLDAIGCGITQVFGQLPTVLPLGGTEQGTDIAKSALSRFAPSKVIADQLTNGFDLVGPLAHLGRCRSS